jgi:hypothetical protein
MVFAQPDSIFVLYNPEHAVLVLLTFFALAAQKQRNKFSHQ